MFKGKEVMSLFDLEEVAYNENEQYGQIPV